MFSIVRSHGIRFAASREIVPLGAALALAEAFYKFHSFTLECVAFLGTWFALSAIWNLAYDAVVSSGSSRTESRSRV